MSLASVMASLKKAGSAQTRKTYLRHGAQEPLFGVSFATLKTLVKRIGVDHELAHALWKTGIHDARVLAYKIADPAQLSRRDLDRWVANSNLRCWGGYATVLAAESPHGVAMARKWLGSSKSQIRASGWSLTGHLAMLSEAMPDTWFAKQLARIEKSIHTVANEERSSMNHALIAIGGRSAALRKVALATAKRVGTVHVDHGDTACKTPDAATYIEKMWAHASAKGFASPAAQERSRESMRTRC